MADRCTFYYYVYLLFYFICLVLGMFGKLKDIILKSIEHLNIEFGIYMEYINMEFEGRSNVWFTGGSYHT